MNSFIKPINCPSPAVCDKLIQQWKQGWGAFHFWFFSGDHVLNFRNFYFLVSKIKKNVLGKPKSKVIIKSFALTTHQAVNNS